MNKFVELDYDKFEQTTVISLKDGIELDVHSTGHSSFVSDVIIYFRKIAIEGKSEGIVIVAQLVSESGFGLSSGQMKMIVDGKHFNIDGHQIFSRPHSGTFHQESAFYILTPEELKIICDASSIDVRLTNGNDFIDLPPTNKLQWGARVLYNAVIDENAYMNEIKEETKRLEEEAKRLEEKEKREEEEARIWYQNSKMREYIRETLIPVCVVGFCLAFFVGGIWGLLIDSWAPVLWIGLITIVIVIILYILF